MVATRSSRRSTRVAIIALSAGALCTLASAWLAALFLGFPNRWENFNGSIFDDPAKGYQIVCYVSRQDAIGGVRYTAGLPRVHRDLRERDRVLLPSWVDFSPPTPAAIEDLGQYVEIAEARGWPWLCFSYHWLEPMSADGVIRGGISLERPLSVAGQVFPSHALPCTPIWPALIGNLALFSFFWFMLLWAPYEARRFWRRRRGCCVACGYSLAGGAHANCPECGEILAEL
ncbi:MAG: hypothetical protein L0Y44_05145 [Phycisphaerales bacterium]|nr:hypothetical protein [Phycisphaerales bacterium]MCI0675649.1 hypothetical protein [Phycisphaerales bacterium]